MSNYIDTIKIGETSYGIEGSVRQGSTESNAEFSISDENGHVILSLKDGDIKTKNFDSSMTASTRAFSIKMERGGLTSSGAMNHTIGSFNNYIRSSYLIRCNGATIVNGLSEHGFTVYQYDEDFTLIKTSNEGETFDDGCRYIKLSKAKSNDISDTMLFAFNSTIEEVCNVQIEKGLDSNSRLKSEMLVFEVSEGICTTARLLLPSNYSIDGKKVPLMIVHAGDGSFVSWDTKIDNTTLGNYTSQIQYLADEGFAVMTLYSWGSYNYTQYPSCGMSAAVPVPVSLLSHEKAVEYVTSRFNISNSNIFMITKSGSGKLSSYYAIHKPKFNLRSIYSFSPVVDGLNFRSWGAAYADARKAMHSEMNFKGDTSAFVADGVSWQIFTSGGVGSDFVTENASKFAVCAAINWQNLSEQTIAEKFADTITFANKFWDEHYYTRQPPYDIYNNFDLTITSDGVPITIIASQTDSATPYMVMEEFIVQLQNGGADANIINLGTGGHTAADVGHAVENVTTRLDVDYASVPYGWHYAVEDIYARFLKSI